MTGSKEEKLEKVKSSWENIPHDFLVGKPQLFRCLVGGLYERQEVARRQPTAWIQYGRRFTGSAPVLRIGRDIGESATVACTYIWIRPCTSEYANLTPTNMMYDIICKRWHARIFIFLTGELETEDNCRTVELIYTRDADWDRTENTVVITLFLMLNIQET